MLQIQDHHLELKASETRMRPLLEPGIILEVAIQHSLHSLNRIPHIEVLPQFTHRLDSHLSSDLFSRTIYYV